MADQLSKQERLFVEAYDGDPVYACRIAGIGGAQSSDNYLKKRAQELLSKPLILEAIQTRSKYILDTKNAIATREERQALWTAIMKNQDPYHKEEVDGHGVPIPEGNIPLPIRLKASELLGKSEADFIDKVQMDVNQSLDVLITNSYKDDTPIEAIEAAYYKHKQKELPQPESLEDLV